MSSTVECPVCGVLFASNVISAHVNSCLNDQEENTEVERQESDTGKQESKKRKSSGGWDFLSPKSKKLNKPSCNTTISQSQHGKISNSKTNSTMLHDKTLSRAENGADIQILNTFPAKVKTTMSEMIQVDSKRLSNSSQGGNSSQGAVLKKSSFQSKNVEKSNIPLAAKMRPDIINHFVGQHQAITKNGLLYNIIMSHTESIPSMIFWGPPGCGKTTLAKIVGKKCKDSGKFKFVTMSATSSSVNEVKQLANVAVNDVKMWHRKTILFLDEIHRFNKTQQDCLLPYVEDGTLTLIGATTENPSFQVNSALLSRCRVVVLEKLTGLTFLYPGTLFLYTTKVDEIKEILKRALEHIGVTLEASEHDVIDSNPKEESSQETKIENGSNPPASMDIEALEVLAGLSDGDARYALNGLQLAWEGCLAKVHGTQCDARISVEIVKEALQRSHVLYDKTGEEHYNIVSAMIKSLRGSDADAALYWMVRMLEGGENPVFVSRRLVIFASEDVGLADPLALTQAVSTHQACQVIGMPECALNLTQCVLYLARVPKSVTVLKSLQAARDCVRKHQGPLPPVPLHLRNASNNFLSKLGYGKGYKYPPDFEEPVQQDYLPPSLKGVKFVPT